MTRVLHIHTLPVISGSGINTFLSMAGLPARFQPALACAPGGRLEDKVTEAGITFYPISGFTQPIAPLRDTIALLQLIRLLRREQFDIVHTHNSKAGFIGRLAARLCGVPVVVHTIHGFAFHHRESAWRRTLFIMLERWAARWATALIAISQPMIDWAVAEKIAQPGTIRKIYSGIEIEPFAAAAPDPAIRQQAGFTNDDFVIGFISKLWEGKGHLDALNALATARQQETRLKLLIVGEGPQQPVIEQAIRDLGLGSDVYLAGFREDVPGLTAACDACILPSYFEGMGRVVLEAMAAGKPVIASRVGGLVELISDGVTGLCVDAGDTAVLASHMLRLSRDPELCRQLSRAARTTVGQRLSSATMVENIIQLYDELLPAAGS